MKHWLKMKKIRVNLNGSRATTKDSSKSMKVILDRNNKMKKMRKNRKSNMYLRKELLSNNCKIHKARITD